MRLFRKLLLPLLCCIPAAAAGVQPVKQPWLRLSGDIHYFEFNAPNTYGAYVEGSGRNLKVINIKTGAIYPVSKFDVGGAFFWTPDGYHLIYRELKATPSGQVLSEVKNFDIGTMKSSPVADLKSASGFPTFDPRDYAVYLMHDRGILTRKLDIPTQRIELWQRQESKKLGFWIATQQGMIWSTPGGLMITKMKDDGSGIQSFDISPDGLAATWATKRGHVYMSEQGGEARLVGAGQDPSWHPSQKMVVYSELKQLGGKAFGAEIKLYSPARGSKVLTDTGLVAERWPKFTRDGKKIVYTLAQTTDLFLMDFKQ
jgi:hypothetical protein